MSHRQFQIALILAIVALTHESPAAEQPSRFPNGPGAFASPGDRPAQRPRVGQGD